MIASIILTAALSGVSAQDVWRDAAVTGQNKELPRTLLVGYPTAEAALAQGDSPFTRPVELEWVTEIWPEYVVYKTRYKIPFAWIDRQNFLRIPYALGPYELRMNGQYVGYTQSGCTPSEFDVTRFSKEGFNDLELKVFTHSEVCRLEDFPEQAKPLLGVTMFSQPRIRVRDIIVDASVGPDGSGVLAVGAVVKSHLLNDKKVTVSFHLLAPDGKIAGAGTRDAQFAMRGEDTLRFMMQAPQALTWGPEGANLYTLVVRTRFEGRDAEFVAVNVGFRNINTWSGEMAVNGVKQQLVLADFIPTGDTPADMASIAALRAKGANVIKLAAGGCLKDDLLDACDRMGVYLCPQAAIDTHLATDGNNPSNTPRWKEAYVDRQMINYHTSKLHPSVVMFSIAGPAQNGMNLYDSYMALKAMNDPRPVIYPYAGKQWNTDADVAPDGKVTFREK